MVQRPITRLSGCSLLALTLSFMASAAHAQSQEPTAAADAPIQAAGIADSSNNANSDQIDDIVVTAQRRSENIQSVPVAVTALSGSTLAAARVTNIVNISNFAPNLTLQPAAGGNNIPIINIRGIVGGNGSLGADNPVALYMDGVYIGDIVGATQDVADIKQIEVLRGPQGTLFGRNSTAGAINITTAAPTGTFDAAASASIGNYGARRYKAGIDLPTFAGIAVKASYLHLQDRGDVRNLGGGTTFDWTDFTRGRIGKLTASNRLGGFDVDAVHAAAHADPTSNIALDYRFDWSKGTYTNQPVQVIGFAEGDGGAFSQSILAAQAANGGTAIISRSRLRAVNNWISTPDHQRVTANSLTADWTVADGVSIKDVIAYRTGNFGRKSNQLDGAGGLFYPTADTPAFLLGVSAQQRWQKQFSNELQFSIRRSAFDLIAGYYHFDLRLREIPAAVNFLQLAPDYVVGGTLFDQSANGIRGESTANIRSNAGFAQGTLHITSRLSATAGGRYTSDRKRIVDAQSVAYPDAFRFSKKHFDYLGNIAFQANANLLAYGKISTGYQSGGVQSGVVYKPEEVTAYEIGMKSDLLDRHVRINLAAFYSDYRNLQFATAGANGLFTLNAGRADIKGGEAEVIVKATTRLTFSGNAGYTDFKYKGLDPAIGTIADYRPTLRPKWTASLGAMYDVLETVSGARLTASADAQYHSNQFFSATRITSDPSLDRALQSGNVWLANARLTLADIAAGGLHGSVSVWGRNLNGDKSLVTANNLGTVLSGGYQRPRTYGVDFDVKF